MRNHKFIERMILRNSVNAALQRANIYDGGADSKLKREFKKEAKKWLVDFGKDYHWEEASEKSKKNWCNNVQSLADSLTRKFGKYLIGEQLKIGVAQKMISLYLKYLWLLGNKNKKPLFAVLDRGIMKAARVKDAPNWTSLNKIEEYERIVLAIDKFATSKTSKNTKNNYSDGAEWEAEKWDDEIDEDESSI
jgi:hypothetical protein